MDQHEINIAETEVHLPPNSKTVDLAYRVQLHFQALDRLSDNLKRLGIDEAEIETHITGIFEDYQAELGRAIDRLREES